jgi:hypothetical protein
MRGVSTYTDQLCSKHVGMRGRRSNNDSINRWINHLSGAPTRLILVGLGTTKKSLDLIWQRSLVPTLRTPAREEHI